MKRSIAVSAAVVVGLLLTACSRDGGDDDGLPGLDAGQEEAQESEGVEDEDQGAPETEPEPEDGGIERPEIDLGGEFENVYDEDDYTGDPVIDTILRDSEGFEDAIAEMIVHLALDRPAIGFYIRDEALQGVTDLFSNIADDGETDIGTARYYNRRVTLFGDAESASVLYCRDDSTVATADIETREVVSEANPDSEPTQYVTRVEKNDLGVWQTVDYSGEIGAEACE